MNELSGTTLTAGPFVGDSGGLRVTPPVGDGRPVITGDGVGDELVGVAVVVLGKPVGVPDTVANDV